jgi:hypothetical protein
MAALQRIPLDTTGNDITRSNSMLSTPTGKYPHFVTTANEVIVTFITTCDLLVRFIIRRDETGRSQVTVETPRPDHNNPHDETYRFFSFEQFYNPYYRISDNLTLSVPNKHGYGFRGLGGTVIVTDDYICGIWDDVSETWQMGSVTIRNRAGYQATLSVV